MTRQPWGKSVNILKRPRRKRRRASSSKQRHLSLHIETLESRQLLTASGADLDPIMDHQAEVSGDSDPGAPLAPLAQTSTTHYVAAGESLQAAINAAQPGDTIELEAGATFYGNYVLPNKIGNDWITIRGSAHESLPDGRVSEADAALMPKLISPNPDPVIRAEFGAHNYRLEGLEVTSTASHTANLIIIGFDGTYPDAVEDFARDFVIDRSYIHGTGDNQVTHAVNAAGSNIYLTNSHVSNIKRTGNDAQAFLAPLGLSNYVIENNFLEATGENIIFGGLGPSISEEFNPENIVVRGNSISKPNTWREGHPDYAGVDYSIKNLVEFKIGKHILVEHNVIENLWSDSQNGVAFVITPRETTIDDIVIRSNIIRNVRSLAVFSPSRQSLSNVVFENNLAYDVDSTLFIALESAGGSIDNLTIRNNTALFGDSAINDGLGGNNVQFGDFNTAVNNFIYQDNIVGGGLYGIHGSGQGVGLNSVLHYANGFDVRGNQVLVPNQTGFGAYAVGNPYDQNGDFYGDFTLWGNAADMGFANLDWAAPEHFDLSGNPALAGKGADVAAILEAIDLPPAVTGITANGIADRMVSHVTSSKNGLTSLEIEFSRPVLFSAQDVEVQRVNFADGLETVDGVAPIQSITGSGTNKMTITFAQGTVVDTWAKVVLHDSIVDLEGRALDGETPAAGRQRDYIWDGEADLPTGNHLDGGDVVFYTGNLVGDIDGNRSVDVTDILLTFSNTTGSHDDADSSTTLTKNETNGDFDNDGDVDTNDLITVFSNNSNRLEALPESITPALALFVSFASDDDSDDSLIEPLLLAPLAAQDRNALHDAALAEPDEAEPIVVAANEKLAVDLSADDSEPDSEDETSQRDADEERKERKERRRRRRLRRRG